MEYGKINVENRKKTGEEPSTALNTATNKEE
jgi:hypothetical protein